MAVASDRLVATLTTATTNHSDSPVSRTSA